jgi:uncharacterized damage-inducible protein DinB
MSIRIAFPAWPLLNSRLTDAVRTLSDEQLAVSADPGRWPLWAVVGHLACQRVFWLCDFAGQPGADTTRFTNAGWDCPGDDDLDNALDGTELAVALASTFAIVESVLDTWTFDWLDDTLTRPEWGPEWRHSRGFVVERVHAHDVWHAAEANEILTAIGREPVDPWN